jgi:glyoxylate/hydroxypyruvate reductase A
MARRDITGAVDFPYLEGFAAGDTDVIDEVLALFEQQAQMWSPMLDSASEGWRDALHTVKGAARGVGAHALGEACARALQALHFTVEGWSRAPKSLPGIVTHHGRDGLKAALQDADLIVTLLPRTPETEGTLNAETLGWTKPGAVILNPGRGALIDDEALLAALDSGQIGHATLDVFRIEPLPQDHPFWAHPCVTVTPHIAADTRPDTSSEVIAENIRRGEAGVPFLNLVDRTRGY